MRELLRSKARAAMRRAGYTKLNKPTLSQTDKLCLTALSGILIATTLVYELTDGRAIRATTIEEDRTVIHQMSDKAVFRGEAPNAVKLPLAENAGIIATPLIEALEARRAELFWEDVPLDLECQEAIREACKANNVPVCLALGVIHAESRFDAYAENKYSYGYMGLNKKYYPSDLTPAENIQAGVAHLAGQIERYDGDIQAALRGYNHGYDDSDRQYARAVLDASEKWGFG